MAGRKLKFAVLGTGNSGQTFAADVALKGHTVNLAEVPAFADNLDAIRDKGGIEISGEAGSGFARLNMMTTDLKQAIEGVDVIFIGGSAHAHEHGVVHQGAASVGARAELRHLPFVVGSGVEAQPDAIGTDRDAWL